MITIQVIDHEAGTSGIAEFPSVNGPSFRSAIAKWANVEGEIASGSYNYDKEDAFTRALIAINKLRAAVNKAIPNEDPHYE